MEDTNEKKQYIAPTLKCVEFMVERGYAFSQGVKKIGTYSDESPQFDGSYGEGNRFGGSLFDNNGDWD